MNRVKLLAILSVVTLAFAGVAQAQWSTNGSNVFYNGGRVGIGTNTPASMLHISGPAGVSNLTFDSPGNQRFRFGTVAAVANWGALTINGSYNAGWFLDDTANNGWFFKLDGRGGNTASENNGLWLFRIPNGTNPHTDESAIFGVTNGRAFFSQKVGIGIASSADPDSMLQVNGTMHVASSLTVDGNIAAKYQDVAEWVPVTETLAPGTVVVIDTESHNTVSSSRRAYQTSVAGVVSAQPGMILGVAGDSKAKIATTGRVKVYVDATRGAIAPGDLLVTSDEPGVAMRSEPVDLGGVKIHRPGTIIGKALEPLASGKGEILVLLTLQ